MNIEEYINGRIDFLTDHWVEGDKPPFNFGGWREEVVADIALYIEDREKKAIIGFQEWLDDNFEEFRKAEIMERALAETYLHQEELPKDADDKHTDKYFSRHIDLQQEEEK